MQRPNLLIVALLVVSSGLSNVALSAAKAAPLQDPTKNVPSADSSGTGRPEVIPATFISGPDSNDERSGLGNPSSGSAADPVNVQPVEKVDIAVICDLIDKNAQATGMPADFFARLLWKESRFDVHAVSPVGAQGIAQFMPYTAEERGLAEPFDHTEAIRHSALYLADLRSELGSWGLAAAAYNGGINRVKRWRANGGFLPLETEEYVNAITFRPAKWFREKQREIETKPLDATKAFGDACRRLPVMKKQMVFASLDPNVLAEIAAAAAERAGSGKKSKAETGVPIPSARVAPEPTAVRQVAALSPPPPPPPPPSWIVQVAGHHDKSTATKIYRRALSAHPSILGGVGHFVERRRAGGPRDIYAVLIGAPSRSDADRICNGLRGAGGACVVFKN